MNSSAVIWTRQFVAERWPSPITPLSAAIMFEAFVGDFLRSDFFSQKICDGIPPVAIINGYPYLNATMFIRLIAQLGIPTPGFIAELYPPEFRPANVAQHFQIPSVQAYYILAKTLLEKRFWRLINLNPFTNHQHWDSFAPRYERKIAGLRPQDASQLGNQELFARLQQCVGLLWEYRRIHLGSLVLGNILYQFLGFLTDSWTNPLEIVKRGHLVSGLPGSMTLATNRALWDMARTIGHDPSYAAMFRTQLPEEILRNLRAEDQQQPVAKAFFDFLERFGHRTTNSYELASPTWKKDPSFVIGVIKEYLETEAFPVSLKNEEEKIELRRCATQKIDQVLRHGMPHKMLPYRRHFFNSLLSLSQKYMLLRENQRFIFDLNLAALKAFIDEAGQRLFAAGALAAPHHIYCLPYADILRFNDHELNAAEVRDLALQNASLHEKYCSLTPPLYIRGDIPVEQPEYHGGQQRSMLAGTGVSGGKVTGRVRIVMNPLGTERLNQDEILVTIGTDPGWTPLFITAVGAIMEIGGMLSHGSVVAREYGLPAVVGIVGATKILRNGQVITVDGDNGVVYI